MTAATRRLIRTPRTPRGPDYVALGRKGKAALHTRMLALRASGPEHTLDWINEDPILLASFEDLAQLGRAGTVGTTALPGELKAWARYAPDEAKRLVIEQRHGGRHSISESRRIFTLADLSSHVMGQLALVGAHSPVKNTARRILESLEATSPAWRTRLRRCAYKRCLRPYFWDATDAGRKRVCSERHKKAAARLTRS